MSPFASSDTNGRVIGALVEDGVALGAPAIRGRVGDTKTLSHLGHEEGGLHPRTPTWDRGEESSRPLLSLRKQALAATVEEARWRIHEPLLHGRGIQGQFGSSYKEAKAEAAWLSATAV